MAINAQCPACRAKLSVPERSAGRTIKCPKCFGPVEVRGVTAGPVMHTRSTPVAEPKPSPGPRQPPTPRPDEGPPDLVIEESPEQSGGTIVHEPSEEEFAARQAALAERTRALREQLKQDENPYESPQTEAAPPKENPLDTFAAEPPWEGRMSPWTFCTTTWAVIAHPLRTFGNLPSTENWRAVWYYTAAYFLQWLGWLAMFWVLIVVMDVEAVKTGWIKMITNSAIYLGVTLGLTLFAGTIGLVISAQFFHGGLRTTGPLGSDGEATLRVMAYSIGACFVFGIFPPLLLLLWPLPLIYVVIGAARAHGISNLRAFFGLLLMFFYIALFAVVVTVIGVVGFFVVSR